uniref:cilia- and flagella-associated protein 100 n=1 Tax=Ciona intestinalis TaxID=7719 RepID=UPI00006A3DEF|nr:cilia- and flagella-associated protein 100 [Ciona intestinalis]|eukprot:XP_002131495.1 cilia- and flagella-associated protein 100 [Ciona intestinalis]
MSEISSNRSPGSAASSRGAGSRQSGRVTFPHSTKSMSSGKSVMQLDDSSDVNPFKVPPDQDIFMLRDKERQRKKEERERQQKLKVHEKTTYASRVNAKTASMRRAALGSEELLHDEEDSIDLAVKDDPSWTLAVTRDRNVEKEDLAEYVSKKREMFLVQYSLRVKRDEMRKLEELAAAEERKLERAEHFLEEDAAMFDEFLKENDKNSVEAIKRAESESKSKLEKVAEIKKNNAIMMAIKSDISKHEETLKEYMLYKEFLEKLTPNEWKEKRRKEQEERRRIKREAQAAHPSQSQNLEKKSTSSITSASRREGESRSSSRVQSSLVRVRSSVLKSGGRKALSTPKSITDTESVRSAEVSFFEEESDEEPELYFTDPAQLLNMFQELEEHNLSLITNSQETEEAMEELKHTIRNTKDKMGRETDMLKAQINMLKATIRREEEKADDLELKCKMFSYGEFKAEDQEKMLKHLDKKVEEVYRGCIGDNEANISTLQMLTTIENKLEDLFENIEVMPPELVEAAEKAKEKERRMRLREEKLAAQRAHQEERVRKALERAKADPKKKAGKRLVFRSEPPQRKQKENKKKEGQDKEEEEKLYFFT